MKAREQEEYHSQQSREQEEIHSQQSGIAQNLIQRFQTPSKPDSQARHSFLNQSNDPWSDAFISIPTQSDRNDFSVQPQDNLGNVWMETQATTHVPVHADNTFHHFTGGNWTNQVNNQINQNAEHFLSSEIEQMHEGYQGGIDQFSVPSGVDMVQGQDNFQDEMEMDQGPSHLPMEPSESVLVGHENKPDHMFEEFHNPVPDTVLTQLMSTENAEEDKMDKLFEEAFL